MTLTVPELRSLEERIDNGIGSDEADACRDASDALAALLAAYEDDAAALEALRDAVYDAAKL